MSVQFSFNIGQAPQRLWNAGNSTKKSLMKVSSSMSKRPEWTPKSRLSKRLTAIRKQFMFEDAKIELERVEKLQKEEAERKKLQKEEAERKKLVDDQQKEAEEQQKKTEQKKIDQQIVFIQYQPQQQHRQQELIVFKEQNQNASRALTLKQSGKLDFDDEKRQRRADAIVKNDDWSVGRKEAKEITTPPSESRSSSSSSSLSLNFSTRMLDGYLGQVRRNIEAKIAEKTLVPALQKMENLEEAHVEKLAALKAAAIVQQQQILHRQEEADLKAILREQLRHRCLYIKNKGRKNAEQCSVMIDNPDHKFCPGCNRLYNAKRK